MKEKLTLWELEDDAEYLRMSIDEIRDDKRKYKEAIHVWIINHLADGVSCENLASTLSIVFMKDYNIMLTAVNARKEDLNKRVAAVKLLGTLDLAVKPKYITHNYTPDEIRIIANDVIQKVPVKKIARIRSVEFNRNGSGLIKKVRQIKRALTKGFSIQDIIDRKTTEVYNKQPEAMRQLKFYTRKENEIIKTAIESGEPSAQIINRLSVLFDRPKVGFTQKVYQMKKKTPVLHKWEGPKRINNVKTINKPKLNFEPDVILQEPAEIGIEVPHGMTFEGKPKKIMLHSDHFRIYF